MYSLHPKMIVHVSNLGEIWSKMTLNYWMMVDKYPNLKEEVGDLIPNYEISSLLDKNLPCGQLPPMLWRSHVGLLYQKKSRARLRPIVH